MKRKFNIYCILMLVAMVVGLTIDFSLNAGRAVKMFNEGWQAADEDTVSDAAYTNYTIAADLMKLDGQYADHHVIDSKTGKMIPAQLATIIVKTGQEHKGPYALLALSTLFSLINIAALIALWVCLIRIVLAVNRGIVFEPVIEQRLRTMGILLLVMYASGWAFALSYYAIEKSIINVAGYEVILSDYPALMQLLSALGLLMIAQIFSIGRQLKEEQALTI